MTLPTDLGYPDKFRRWREHQFRAVTDALDSPKRFVLLALPTGAGKSLCYMVAASLHGGRACILTSTKGLQSQLMSDFSDIGLFDVMGQNNYQCLALEDDTCDKGPCHVGVPCMFKSGGCLYYDAQSRAKSSRMVSTNYAYWLSSKEHLGKFDLLVLDEAHNAADELSNHMTIELNLSWFDNTPQSDHILEWSSWAFEELDRWKERVDYLQATHSTDATVDSVRDAHFCREVTRRLLALSSAKGKWVVDRDADRIKLCPVWPGDYSDDIFSNCDKVILTSATLRAKTADMLGIKDYDFFEYPSVFDPSSRPVYLVPSIRVSHTSTDDDLVYWLSRIDGIVGSRLDRKGIIHTVSYDRRNYILRNSSWSGVMLSHGKDNIASVVSRFRRSKPPKVLVSPSLSTGWDFPGDDCRFQIMAKMPFPDRGSKLVRARSEYDRDYDAYHAIQSLVQCCGRGMRSKEDWCENYVVDDNMRWMLSAYRSFFPGWFLQSVRRR